MSDEPKSLATIILAKMKNGKTDTQSVKNESQAGEDPKEGLRSAAEDVMHAFKSSDVTALMEALKSFIELAEDSEPDQE